MRASSFISKSMVFIIAAFTLHTAVWAAEGGISWHKYKQPLFKQAVQDKKPILIFVKAEWCPHCHKMRETTLRDPGVVKLVNDNFIPIQLDADSDRQLAIKYKVSGLPAFIVVNGKNKIVESFSGEMPIIEFMGKLTQAYRDFQAHSA